MLQQSYNQEAYAELMEFLNRHSLDNGDEFCASLMRESSRHKALGMLADPGFFLLKLNEHAHKQKKKRSLYSFNYKFMIFK